MMVGRASSVGATPWCRSCLELEQTHGVVAAVLRVGERNAALPAVLLVRLGRRAVVAVRSRERNEHLVAVGLVVLRLDVQDRRGGVAVARAQRDALLVRG